MKVIVFLLFVIASYAGFAQPTDDNAVLGRAGNKTISVLDFKARFEFTPHFGSYNEKNIANARLDFLYSLLSEKLWAIEAVERGYDTTSVMRMAAKAYENMFIRDRLYRKEIREKVTYTKKEFRDAVRRQCKTLYVNYLYSEDSTEIFNLHHLLKSQVLFDSILSASPEAADQKNPEEIVYGQMAEEMEDVLFNLKKNEYTKPMKSPEGWYIFKLVDYKEEVTINPESKESSIGQKALKVLTTHKERVLFRNYFIDFFKNKKIEANAALLKSLAYHISQIFTEKKKAYKITDKELIPLFARDVIEIQNKIGGDTLSKVLFTLEKQKYTLNDFLLALGFDVYKTENPELNALFKNLQIRARKFIESELLSMQGRKLGLEKDPEVEREVALWRDNYLYQMVRGKILDSAAVSDSEALAYYNSTFKEKKFPKQANIIEILTDNIETASLVFGEAKAGKDFRELSKKYNKRNWTQKSGGEYGYFPTFMFGAIGEAASHLDVGEIYGPIKVPEGFSVIKLIGKKDEYVEYPAKTFDQVQDQIKNMLTYQRVKRKMDLYTVELAKKYGMDITPDVFKSLETTTITSFGIRHLGFGGQVTAAPLLAPDNDWVEEYFKQQKIVP